MPQGVLDVGQFTLRNLLNSLKPQRRRKRLNVIRHIAPKVARALEIVTAHRAALLEITNPSAANCNPVSSKYGLTP